MNRPTLDDVAALAAALFNSILFPAIFSPAPERSGVSARSASGLLALAISLFAWRLALAAGPASGRPTPARSMEQ